MLLLPDQDTGRDREIKAGRSIYQKRRGFELRGTKTAAELAKMKLPSGVDCSQ